MKQKKKETLCEAIAPLGAPVLLMVFFLPLFLLIALEDCPNLQFLALLGFVPIVWLAWKVIISMDE